MAGNKYQDENNQYWFDFTKALWSTNELTAKYTANIHSVLSSVDFIAETDKEIVFVEYKNADIKNAVNPQAFITNLTRDEHYQSIAKKFYGGLIYILVCNKNKKYKYVYILECMLADSVTRRRLRNKISRKLPFTLQKEPEIKIELISDFDILSIAEWNSNPAYSSFPISKV